MNGTIETMVAAVSKAIEQGVGRKNLVAIVAIVTLATMAEASLKLCLLVAGVAALAVMTQWSLDLYEVRKTGADQKDNGHGQPEAVIGANDHSPESSLVNHQSEMPT